MADKSSQEYDKQMRELKRDSKEMRLYLLTRISQLHKELSFWRDTVRKMLYNSQNEFQTADKVIDAVTSTLKTYTTRGRSDDNMDEMLYLAQVVSRIGPVDKDKIWAEKLDSQPTFYPYVLRKRWS